MLGGTILKALKAVLVLEVFERYQIITNNIFQSRKHELLRCFCITTRIKGIQKVAWQPAFCTLVIIQKVSAIGTNHCLSCL